MHTCVKLLLSSTYTSQELCNEMESKLHAYTDVKNAVHRMLESSNVVRGSSTEHCLSILEQRWASVYSKVQERKVIFSSSNYDVFQFQHGMNTVHDYIMMLL